MADQVQDEGALRNVRDALREQLTRLDELGESAAAIELNSAIEILNVRLGEATSAEEIARLQRNYFLD